MDVVLLKDLSFGDKGTVIKVSNGHARNYLLPNNLALEATKQNVKHIEKINAQRKKKLEKEKSEVEALAKKINDHKELVIEAKGSESGSLFGSVTNIQITDLLNKTFGHEFDRRRVLVKNLREPGSVEIPIKLTFGILAKAKLKIELVVEKPKAEKGKGRKKKAEAADEVKEEKKKTTKKSTKKEEAKADEPATEETQEK